MKAGQQEQRSGREAVRNHLVHRAVRTLLVESEDSEHDESEMAERTSRRSSVLILVWISASSAP